MARTVTSTSSADLSCTFVASKLEKKRKTREEKRHTSLAMNSEDDTEISRLCSVGSETESTRSRRDAATAQGEKAAGMVGLER
jgi:hypothetical protein